MSARQNPRPPSASPFSIEDFGVLVSTALDVQRVPDSALAFSLGTTPAPSICSPRSRRSASRQAQPFKLPPASLSKFRDAFVKKQSTPQTPDHIRKLASTSVPQLSQLAFLPSSSNVTLPSASVTDLHNLDQQDSDSESLSPSLSSAMPYTPVSPPHIHDLKLHSKKSAEWNRKANQVSFLNLKPLSIPKLNKKSSRKKLFFSNSSQLPTPDTSFSAPNTSIPRDESYGMRSFFDDSGYEDEVSHIFFQKKSRPKLKAFFSSGSAVSTVKKSRISSSDGCDVGQKISLDKDLPPTPPFTEHVLPSHPYHLQQTSDSGGDSDHYESTSFLPSSSEKDLFYRPSLVISTNCESRNFKEELEARPIRASNPSPRRAGRRLRSSPSPYPSPNSPLPPTPELSPVGLPVVSPPNSDHYHGEDRSIDSLEILTWRMPALQLQVSKTSSNSSAALEHARGRPSRDSIHERLGLGPQLHILGSLPDRPDTPPRTRKMPKHVWQTSPRRSATHPRASTKPSSKATKGGKRPIAALASASFVSLRSIATITASTSHGDKVDEIDDPYSELNADDEIDRVFTPDEDPFAAMTPVSIISPTGNNSKAGSHSFTTLQNHSVGLLHTQDDPPSSAPATLADFSHCQVLPPSPQRNHHRNSNSPGVLPGLAAPDDSSPSSMFSSLPPVRPRTTSTPSIVRETRRLNVFAALTRRKQGNANSDPPSRDSPASSDDGKRILGHSNSRPHSPFPLLFSRSKSQRHDDCAKNTHTAPNRGHQKSPLVTRDSLPREELIESSPDLSGVRDSQYTGVCYSSPKLSAGDTDVFGDICDAVGDSAAFELKRDIVSPTAYLLETDEYDEASSIEGRYAQANTPDTLGYEKPILEDYSIPVIQAKQARQLDDTLCKQRDDTESETDTDYDTNNSELDHWPLPPYRTVVVDLEKGEGWHEVEPIVEYAPPCGFQNAPRHTILSPMPTQSIASSDRAHSRSSSRSSGSYTSQKLSSIQARLIANRLACKPDTPHDNARTMRSPEPGKQLKELVLRRAQSNTSFASMADSSSMVASVNSLKTTRSAYFSVCSRMSDESRATRSGSGVGSGSVSSSSSRSRHCRPPRAMRMAPSREALSVRSGLSDSASGSCTGSLSPSSGGRSRSRHSRSPVASAMASRSYRLGQGTDGDDREQIRSETAPRE